MQGIAACPCDTGAAYPDCCGKLHDGAVAPDALALMRSRYAAYVLGNEQYLMQSWHPDTRPASLPGLVDDNTKWLGLKIISHAMADSDSAVVEFVARYRQGGASAVRLHEISRFQREQGRWFYLDGIHPE